MQVGGSALITRVAGRDLHFHLSDTEREASTKLRLGANPVSHAYRPIDEA